jgi:3-phosphoshikimate 1-carboxyvinyltransferase
VPDVLRLSTASRPLDAVVDVPGSKSIANRALVCAALADGDTTLTNVPGGDDTVAMLGCLGALGIAVSAEADEVRLAGSGGRLDAADVVLDAVLAGTTSRFVTALAALAPGPVTVDGAPPLRRRPMGPLHTALASLGVAVEPGELPGNLPVTVRGPLRTGGTVALPGDVSSQYLTALMLIGPSLTGGLRLRLTTPLVSVPYVRLTASVMAEFGVGGVEIGSAEIVVPEGRYAATTLAIEPDASSASYPLAMAAVAGGRVQVRGLHRTSAQGDAVFADLLADMGCTVSDDADGLTVARDPATALTGIDVDLADVSDLVPTVAAVAVTATTPTRITGVGFIRAKESDRLGDLAAELGALGADVTVEADGLRIAPAGPLRGAALATHHDHRLAMAFGVLGVAVPDVVVAEPGVVSKSWPDFWAARRRILGE